MQLTVKGKQMDVGDALRGHVQQRLTDAVSKYFDHALEASAVISREAHEFRADISVHVGRGILLQGHSLGDTAYTAFDSALERIAKRLRRYKRRLRDHHRKEKPSGQGDPIVAQQYVLSEKDENEGAKVGEAEASPPIVVAEMTTEIETLTVEEAVMRMELADQPTVMFHNAAHGGLNVVYRREDGNFGWIDPQGNSQSRRIR